MDNYNNIYSTAQTPDKWLKYQILSLYNLADIQDFNTNIKRFLWSEKDNIYKFIIDDLINEAKFGNEIFYVIKLIPINIASQLPNLRIYSKQDLDQLPSFFNNNSLNEQAVEVWTCKTLINKEKFNAAGRILFAHGYSEKKQVIEQVWNCSPRLIESYNSYFTWPYIKAERLEWSWHWNYQNIHIPINSNYSKDCIQKEFINSIIILEKYRKRIELLASLFKSQGADCFSIEYKVNSNTLSFIDWDTPIDKQIINFYKKMILNRS